MNEFNIPGNQELTFLSFVASALPYLSISESSFIRIIEKAISRAISLGANEDVSAISVLELILNSSERRWELAEKEILNHIEIHISGKMSSELLFSMYKLGYVANEMSRRPLRGDLTPLKRMRDNFERMRLKNRSHLREIALENVNVARAYVYLYGEGWDFLFDKHGLDFIASSASPLVPDEINNLIFSALRGAILDSTRRSGKGGMEDYQRFVHRLANSIVGENLRLGRLLLPLQSKGGMLEHNIEMVFRDLWTHVRRGARGEASNRQFAECLICILSASEMDTQQAGPPRRGRAYRYGFPLPAGVIVELIDLVQEPDLRVWLDRWVQENISGMDDDRMISILELIQIAEL